jgi:hypothetical protein
MMNRSQKQPANVRFEGFTIALKVRLSGCDLCETFA